MASNFDFLLEKPEFDFFATACVDAENVLATSSASAAFGCRRALELAVKWVYAAEKWPLPYSDNLQSLIHGQPFQREFDRKNLYKFKYIIRLGNNAAHSNKSVEEDEVILALSHLFEFIEWIDYSFGKSYELRAFDEKKIPKKTDLETDERFQSEISKMEQEISARDQQLSEKDGIIAALKAQLTLRNPELAAEKDRHQKERIYQVVEPGEFETRKKYIDVDLKMVGWVFNENVSREVEVIGMDGKDGQRGRVDYVLYGKDGRVLAVVEAKRSSKDHNIGKHQAKLYADCIEAETGRRPFIFLTNGFETSFWDGDNPPREVSGIFGQNDLEKLMIRREQRRNLAEIEIDESITDRYYQKEAVIAVRDDVMKQMRRHLLVMATGTGKTRTAASLVDVLSRGGHITNILFLADRNALVNQAKDAFKNYLPTMSLCNLVTNKDDKNARIVFSTYPTILNAIDDEKSEDGSRFFTPAHFDLIIIDEAHRSIFKKYRAIFEYFDSHLIGLTATPKNEVARNTYDFFEKEPNVPTYAYDYETAVEKDHVLVPYHNFDMGTKFLTEGITYNKLSEADKERYEEDFGDDDGNIPDSISQNQLNNTVFNEDTVDKVLQTLMEKGIKKGGGIHLGKTIIFAQNNRHAQYLIERFDKLYPQYKGEFAKKITYEENYAQSMINDFKVKDKMPQIAVSVDMLDTGIDVPEVVNLVFFKKVFSRTKFWQMIGRGTRLCEGLECFDHKSGGYEKKQYFYIFDVMNNFKFFDENQNIPESNEVKAIPEMIFSKRVELIFNLQTEKYSDDTSQKLRQELIQTILSQINALNPELFTVRRQLRYVEKFKEENAFVCLTETEKADLIGKVASLVYSDDPDESAVAFDNLIYGMMLNQEKSPQFNASKKTVMKIARDLMQKATIPQIREKLEYIRRVESDSFWHGISILDLEYLRVELRNLFKFIIEPGQKSIVFTRLTDELTIQDGKSADISIDLENYKRKVTRYLEDHRDKEVIFKIRHNIPLNNSDYAELENLLTNELGTKEDYEKEFGEIPFGSLIRQIVKLDEKAAKDVFSDFMSRHPLNQDQMHFMNQLIQYLCHNGYIDKMTDLRLPPFDKPVSFMNLFDSEERKELAALISQVKSNTLKTE